MSEDWFASYGSKPSSLKLNLQPGRFELYRTLRASLVTRCCLTTAVVRAQVTHLFCSFGLGSCGLRTASAVDAQPTVDWPCDDSSAQCRGSASAMGRPAHASDDTLPVPLLAGSLPVFSPASVLLQVCGKRCLCGAMSRRGSDGLAARWPKRRITHPPSSLDPHVPGGQLNLIICRVHLGTLARHSCCSRTQAPCLFHALCHTWGSGARWCVLCALQLSANVHGI